MTRKIVVDEEELLKAISANGFSGTRPSFSELLVLAKGIRAEMGWGETRIVRHLSDVWSDWDDFFDEDVEAEYLKKVARAAVKIPELKVPNYPIIFAQNELDAIRTVRDMRYQRVIFSALSFAKSSGSGNFFSGSNKSIRFILKISGTRLGIKDFVERVSPVAKSAGIFKFVIAKGSFYTAMLKPDGVPVLSIDGNDDFYNAGKLYQSVVGKLSWCSLCGKEFNRQSNNHRLCKTCSEKKRKEDNRYNVSRFRRSN